MDEEELVMIKYQKHSQSETTNADDFNHITTDEK